MLKKPPKPQVPSTVKMLSCKSCNWVETFGIKIHLPPSKVLHTTLTRKTSTGYLAFTNSPLISLLLPCQNHKHVLYSRGNFKNSYFSKENTSQSIHVDPHCFLRLNIIPSAPHLKAVPLCSGRQKVKAKPTEPMETLLSEVTVCRQTPIDSFGPSVLSNNANTWIAVLLEVYASEACLEMKKKCGLTLSTLQSFQH